MTQSSEKTLPNTEVGSAQILLFPTFQPKQTNPENHPGKLSRAGFPGVPRPCFLTFITLGRRLQIPGQEPRETARMLPFWAFQKKNWKKTPKTTVHTAAAAVTAIVQLHGYSRSTDYRLP